MKLFFNFSILIALMLCSCSKKQADGTKVPEKLNIFQAAGLSGVIQAAKPEAEKKLNLEIRAEPSGSQVVCRKVTELGREADLMMVADNRLFKKIAASHCKWRLDFANDEVVIGVGKLARKVDSAEKNWVPVMLDKSINIGRVDENLGPIGYRTLLVWKLKGNDKLMNQLKTKCTAKTDHVSSLATLLKAGEIDYGFLYRSTCVNYDIRYIQLEKQVNLGAKEFDYSKAEVTFEKPGRNEKIKIKGSPITFSLSIPENARNREAAIRFIRWLFTEQAGLFETKGFSFFKPVFYGTREDYEPFKDFVVYGGEF